jgi:hypothetical protein
MGAVATPERERADQASDDGRALEAVILRAWDELAWDGRCACPVCGGHMAADPALIDHGPTGTCESCGSELS